jgi:hypothetical protein
MPSGCTHAAQAVCAVAPADAARARKRGEQVRPRRTCVRSGSRSRAHAWGGSVCRLHHCKYPPAALTLVLLTGLCIFPLKACGISLRGLCNIRPFSSLCLCLCLCLCLFCLCLCRCLCLCLCLSHICLKLVFCHYSVPPRPMILVGFNHLSVTPRSYKPRVPARTIQKTKLSSA